LHWFILWALVEFLYDGNAGILSSSMLFVLSSKMPRCMHACINYSVGSLLLEFVATRLSATNSEWRPGIADVKNGGPVRTVCDGARQLLLQRTPTEGSYQQSLFGKFLVWSLLILGTVAVQDYRTSLGGFFFCELFLFVAKMAIICRKMWKKWAIIWRKI
jgi:hypothetical protein